MFELLKRLAVEETGADATEYALLAALVAVALIGGASFLGGRVTNLINGVGNTVNQVVIPTPSA